MRSLHQFEANSPSDTAPSRHHMQSANGWTCYKMSNKTTVALPLPVGTDEAGGIEEVTHITCALQDASITSPRTRAAGPKKRVQRNAASQRKDPSHSLKPRTAKMNCKAAPKASPAAVLQSKHVLAHLLREVTSYTLKQTTLCEAVLYRRLSGDLPIPIRGSPGY